MQLIPGWTLIEPGEVDLFGMDFAKELKNETLVSTSWTCTLENPGQASDSNPSAALVGQSFISGTQSWQKITGQVDGAVYRLNVEAVTNTGRTLYNWATLPCSSQ